MNTISRYGLGGLGLLVMLYGIVSGIRSAVFQGSMSLSYISAVVIFGGVPFLIGMILFVLSYRSITSKSPSKNILKNMGLAIFITSFVVGIGLYFGAANFASCNLNSPDGICGGFLLIAVAPLFIFLFAIGLILFTLSPRK